MGRSPSLSQLSSGRWSSAFLMEILGREERGNDPPSKIWSGVRQSRSWDSHQCRLLSLSAFPAPSASTRAGLPA